MLTAQLSTQDGKFVHVVQFTEWLDIVYRILQWELSRFTEYCKKEIYVHNRLGQRHMNIKLGEDQLTFNMYMVMRSCIFSLKLNKNPL